MCDQDFVLAIAGGGKGPPPHTGAVMLADRLAPQACMLYHAWVSRRSENSDSGAARNVLTFVDTATGIA